MAGWLTYPLQLHSSREFDCESAELNPGDCAYYQQRWHFWYIADYVYGLSTIAFFMCTIGIFIIPYLVSQAYAQTTPPQSRNFPIWRKALAAIRYLSYRGLYIKSLRWNSAPIGVLLLGLVGVIYFFCMDLVPSPYYWSSEDFGHSSPLGTRSGWLALACMPFVFATASKANWITLVTGVTHEKLQVFHRWISYAFLILALMHTFPFIVYHIRFHDMMDQFSSGLEQYWTGIVALIFQTWLTFASFSPIRNLNYEFFKSAHFFSAAVFVVIFFWHCDYTLTSWDYFIATAAVYVPCFLYPWLRTCIEYGGRQKAQVLVEDNGFTRITIPVNFDWVPGQHCFLRFTSFGLSALTSHPFTICSLPSRSPDEQSQITFYIRHKRGFTAQLYNYALEHPSATLPVLVDGPYGGIDPQKLYTSDRVIVIAGGSGAGWTLPFIEQFARRALVQENHDCTQDIETTTETLSTKHNLQNMRRRIGPRSMQVILSTRDTATRVWFHKTVASLLGKYPTLSSSSDFEVQVYLTGEAEQHSDSPRVLADLESQSSSIEAEKMTAQKEGVGIEAHNVTESRPYSITFADGLHGRPALPRIIADEAAKAARTGQSLGVFVCGPSTMQNDVRNAVAEENWNIVRSSTRSCGVYLHMEHFSWA